MKRKTERLKRLSCYRMDTKEFIRRMLEVDPKPLWEEGKADRQEKEEKKRKKEESGEAA
jgi:hypothetical protein